MYELILYIIYYMTLITVNLSYYNQSIDILKKHLEEWNKFPEHIKKKFVFFIIDDCSKIPINDILKGYNFEDLNIHLYRVLEDKYCNIAGVRNLGAKECNTPWMIILDMDTVINSDMAIQVVRKAEDNINDNVVFKFNRKVPNIKNHVKHNQSHPAVCLIRKEDYWNIGGCEEDLVGHYGQTDPSFWYKSNGKVRIVIKKSINLLYYPEGESDINRDKKHNAKLFKDKVKNKNWSTDYIRFKWIKLL